MQSESSGLFTQKVVAQPESSAIWERQMVSVDVLQAFSSAQLRRRWYGPPHPAREDCVRPVSHCETLLVPPQPSA